MNPSLYREGQGCWLLHGAVGWRGMSRGAHHEDDPTLPLPSDGHRKWLHLSLFWNNKFLFLCLLLLLPSRSSSSSYFFRIKAASSDPLRASASYYRWLCSDWLSATTVRSLDISTLAHGVSPQTLLASLSPRCDPVRRDTAAVWAAIFLSEKDRKPEV